MRSQTWWQGNKANLFSEQFTPVAESTCFSFWYYIYGKKEIDLSVYLTSQNENKRFISTIDHRDEWHCHLININITKTFQLVLEVIFHGNISDARVVVVDDISLTDELCQGPSICSTAAPTTTGVPASAEKLSSTSKTTGVPASADKSSSTSNITGIIVGVVVGIGIIVGLGTFLLCYIRRSKYVGKKHASRDNQILSNESTGQSVALPGSLNPTSTSDGYTELQTKNDKYEHDNSHFNTSINISGRKYAQLDQSKNLSDTMAGNNLHANGDTNHDYIYLDETDAGSTQTSIRVPGVNMLNEEIHKSNEYAVIDPNSDHSNGMAKDVTHSTPSLGNYVILDPNETGFFRSNGNKDAITDYEFAVPINDNECSSDLHDPYTASEEGAYDSANIVRHKEAESNIYNHAVENAYDTSSHERKIVNKEGTYDHFFGDETEDNYNISKRE